MLTPEEDGSLLHVLVVDHDDVSRTQTVTRLLEEGCDVSVARTAQGLSERILRLKPDVLIIDVLMPGLRGEEMLRLLARSRVLRTPAVVLHTRVLSGYLKRAIDMRQVAGVIKIGSDEATFRRVFRTIVSQLPNRPKSATARRPVVSGLHFIHDDPEGVDPTLIAERTG